MPPLPALGWEDKKAIDTIIWLLLIALFALFGASAKLLYTWRPTHWTRALGSLMTSIFAAWLVGLSLWRLLESTPTLLFACTGSAAWLGGELVDRFARMLARTIRVTDGPVP